MTDDMLFTHAQNARAGELHQLTPFVRRIIAPNAGPYTFTGTCTYLVGRGDVAVIDPGPHDLSHIEAICRALDGERLTHICITHTHKDHSPAAQELRVRMGAPIVGCAPILSFYPHLSPHDLSNHDHDYQPDYILTDGERVMGKSYTLTALATPGHAKNHLCFAFAQEQSLVSGDHVMGWSTSVIAPPDGHMRDYMDSLRRLAQRTETVYWPGHGDAIIDPHRKIQALLTHRLERERAILAALAAGDDRIAALVARLYEGLDERLLRGASLSVLAHMQDLIERGEVSCSDAVPTLTSQYQAHRI